MSAEKVQPIAPKFIERGIEKYKGKVDHQLERILANADCKFTPYRFEDGRYLLVQPDTNFGFLYPDIDAVYAKLVLD